jgi:transposase-like protein
MSARQRGEVSSFISRPLSHCPRCGSADLEPIVESVVHDVHFLCRGCNRCWDVALGSVHRVTPRNCLGCTGRVPCESVYAADHGGVRR